MGINLNNKQADKKLDDIQKVSGVSFDKDGFKQKLTTIIEKEEHLPKPSGTPDHKIAKELPSKSSSPSRNDQTFLGGDVFKNIKEKYMRDSQQYESLNASDNKSLESILHSMSDLSRSLIHNKEAKLGILQ